MSSSENPRAPATSADLSLALLKKALIQASSRPVTTDNLHKFPTGSSPIDDKPRTNFGFTAVPLKRFAADPPPTESLDSKTTPVRNTQALRSELRALQEGLVQLKQAIATRRARTFAAQKSSAACLPVMLEAQEPPADAVNRFQANMHRPSEQFVFEDDALSQTESAAPSAALQTHILNALQTMTARLQRLEESRPPAVDEPSADHQAVEATLQAEVTEERFKRLKLEALVRVLMARLGMETDSFEPLGNRAAQQVAETAFDPSAILSMSPPELRMMIQSLSIRTKEALRLQTAAKCKLVQLNSALRTVSDLAARIVELEEVINRTQGGEQTPPNKADTIQDLSLRVRSQIQTIRALKQETAIMREGVEDAHFDLKRVSDDFLASVLRSWQGPRRPPSRAQSVGPKRNLTQRKPTLARSELAGTPSDTPSPPGTYGRLFAPGAAPPSINLPDPPADLDSTGNLNMTPASASGDYIPQPDDPIDIAVANFVNNRINKVNFVRLRPNYYMFGSLSLRIGLSATTKTPLAYHEGRKYSLRKFVTLFEDSEYMKQQRMTAASMMPRRPMALRQTRLPTEEHTMACRSGRGSPFLQSPDLSSPSRIKLRASMSEGPGERDRPRSLLPPFPSSGSDSIRNVATLASDPADTLGMSLGHWRPRPRHQASPAVPNLRSAEMPRPPHLRLLN